MGQQLAVSCCKSGMDGDNQELSHANSSLSKAVFSADNLLDLTEGPEPSSALTPSSTSSTKLTSRVDSDVLVKEVTEFAGRNPCYTVCCRSDPPSRHGLTTITAQLAEEDGRVINTPRLCNSPKECAEAEWNSAVLMSELNARAYSLSFEFVPMPASTGPASRARPLHR
mmetsp:Transcript_7069/g.13126  ORF Transcript_7069/g.13126 Transcript_7069/m.13126 type:complete len:169 (-) Transcript_7069:159-665(-)|eukprot:CAMPEP_0172720388 /NCGR_PEP_ID=MMETSP1074-20121228/76773_1 /TAXON_ID=2916 /ORGANISM="Ceratium fusus, Strain PA161109" /LENGTH=168 /DNA_ID=CAMNT_0013545897 /DNA_START=101 /DNA_END=607 /DNA_ORIENTATION=+